MPTRTSQPERAPASAEAPSALAPWEFAGLFVTYWCNARCAFCYVHGGPERGGHMSVETAVALWRGLDELAAAHGKTMRIHLAGGEPFRDWPQLLAILQAARAAGLSPAEKIETNAFWATDDAVTEERLRQLAALGVGKLVVSADVFHQAFIPPERVRRCVEVARRVLGRDRVRVRWWDFFETLPDLRNLDPTKREQEFRSALERHKDRLTGRAAERLADLLPLHPADRFRGDACVEPVLRSRHVHIDAYGHVFPGVCSGIILGCAGRCSVVQLWGEVAEGWQRNPVVAALVAGGSYELMQRAKAFGYTERPAGYANKCHLCTHVRQFLFERGIWPEYIGPAECYATPPLTGAARPPNVLADGT